MSFLSNDHLLHPHGTGENAAQAFAAHPLPPPAAPILTAAVLTAYDTAAASGRVQLDADLIRRLRQARFMSQQDLADDCWRRNIQLSLSTIKRAEMGRAVRFRIAREFARCFNISTIRIASGKTQSSARSGMTSAAARNAARNAARIGAPFEHARRHADVCQIDLLDR